MKIYTITVSVSVLPKTAVAQNFVLDNLPKMLGARFWGGELHRNRPACFRELLEWPKGPVTYRRNWIISAYLIISVSGF